MPFNYILAMFMSQRFNFNTRPQLPEQYPYLLLLYNFLRSKSIFHQFFMMKWQALKGDSKNQFFGRPVDRKLSVTQLPMGHLTQNFACEDLLWGTFDFCSSQGHISTEAKPFLAPKCHWPLNMSYDLDLNKNQMYLPKDPHMQNFKLIGPLGADLQTPPVQWTGLCCLCFR